MQHLSTIPNTGTLKDLAEAVGNLRYDALEDFFYELQQKLYTDSQADRARGRPVLAMHLSYIADTLAYAKFHTAHAWEVCEPYMKEKV